METGEYFSAWVVYLGSACAVIACLWWLCRLIPQLMVRLALLFCAAAVLLTPVTHPVNPSLYVPAIAAAALSFIADGQDAAWPYLSVVLLAVAVALLLVLMINFVQSRLAGRSDQEIPAEIPEQERVPPDVR